MPRSTEIHWLVSISLHTCVSDGCSVLFQKLPGFQVFLASTGCRNKNLGGVVTTVICCFDVVVSHSKCVVVPNPPPPKKKIKFEWGEKELDAMLEEKLCRSRNFSRCPVKKEKKGQTKKTITEEIHYLV